MHPAYSVIFFTTASGAGYGLLIWLALFRMFGVIPPERWLGFFGLGLALGLISLGLLASTAHLGHPERAWRAFTQWRSSWLSREGIAAVATYVPAGLLGLGWVVFESGGFFMGLAAILTTALALVTVWCTGMIYASLPTIRQWHKPLVAPLYVVLGLATGAVLFNALLWAFGMSSDLSVGIATVTLGAALVLKWLYWRQIDTDPKTYTAESATGLGRDKGAREARKADKVRPLDLPHDQANFVMREMGYKVGRKHALVLRFIATVLTFVIPLVLFALVLLGISPGFMGPIAIAALLSAAMGILVERWLFFAEAEHVVMLYYGAKTA